MVRSGIKVYAPATVSNVGVGFNVLGFAVEKPGDEVLIREGLQKGLVISKITGAGGKLSTDTKVNTAGIAAQKLLEYLGEAERPLEMEIHKHNPIKSGLSSSASSAVAGVFAVNEFVKAGLTKTELLQFAVEAEQLVTGNFNALQVAPSLLGGMILIHDHLSLDFKKLYLPQGLFVVLIHPEMPVQVRQGFILEQSVDFDIVLKQQANLASFVSAMYTSDLSLLARCLEDVMIEPQIAHHIPLFYDLKALSLQEGALGFSISGNGPAMFAICDNSLKAEAITEKAAKLYFDHKIKAETWITKINHEGAVLF